MQDSSNVTTLKKVISIHRFIIYRYGYMLVCYYERPQTIYAAMALMPPLVLVWKQKHLHSAALYKHECIHHRQIIELCIFPFFIWYGLEYFIGRLKGLKHYEAYRNISFEKEAYHGEKISGYASKPQWFGFLKFLR